MKKLIPALLVFCYVLISTHLSAQTWKWVTGSGCPQSVIEAWPVAVGGNGNVYGVGDIYNVIGWPSGSIVSYFGTDTVMGGGGVVVCTDSNGHYLWEVYSANGGFNGIVADHDNVYAFGNFFLSMSLGGFSLTTPWSGSFCAKINSTGHVEWLKKYCDSSQFQGGAIDGAGNIYLAGSFQGARVTIGTSTLVNTSVPGGYDALVIKIDSSGAPLWASRFGGDSDENLIGIAVNNAGEAFVAGTFNSSSLTVGSSVLHYTPGAYGYGVVAKLSATGTPVWGDQITDRDVLLMNAICLDFHSNVYIAGGCQGNVLFGPDSVVASTSTAPFFLASYNSAGAFRWVRSKRPSEQIARSVVADACGNVFICGQHYFASIPPVDPMYIYTYDTLGNTTDSTYISTGGDDQCNLAVDNKGNLYVCGDSWTQYRTDTFYFGSDTLFQSDSSLETLFIAKYSYPTCPGMFTMETPQVNITGNITPLLYPNPANDECTIQMPPGAADISRVDVYDFTGRLIRTYPASRATVTISLSGLSPGIYTCITTTADEHPHSNKLTIIR